MVLTLSFRPDLNPLLLHWVAPDEPHRHRCSICEQPFRVMDCPLVLWREEDGWCLWLCDACVDRWVRVT